MVNIVLLYVGAGLTAIWGIAHFFPTSSVVKGFGEISADNKKIITNVNRDIFDQVSYHEIHYIQK